jgi:hypothetical protein
MLAFQKILAILEQSLALQKGMAPMLEKLEKEITEGSVAVVNKLEFGTIPVPLVVAMEPAPIPPPRTLSSQSAGSFELLSGAAVENSAAGL